MLISLLAASAMMGPAQFASAINPFGVDVFKALAIGQRDKNVLVSPLSLGTCLSMAAEGADGKTWAEMSRTLRMDKVGREEMNRGAGALAEELRGADQATRMEIANALWANQSYRFESSYVDTLQKVYGAQAKALDFKAPSTIPTMNKWVEEKTHGKITKIVEDLPTDSLMVLMNAVSFKGDWVNPFDPGANYKAQFRDAGELTFMRKLQRWDYAEDQGVQFLRIPYGNSRYSMEIALPAENADADAFIGGLTAEKWGGWSKAAKTKLGMVFLPKWKGDYALELSGTLKRMGMPDAFRQGANFTRMIKNVPAFIGLVNHKTFIQVDEKGTEAAAVTSIQFRAGSAPRPEERFEFDANRPFVYAITEAETGAMLFLGVVRKPNQ